jgi:predicted CopG family antitoxin
MSAKRKIISVNEQTYLALKRLGLAGDSFNDVLSKMLKNTSCSKKTQNEEEAEA